MSADFIQHLDALLAEDLLRPAQPGELTHTLLMQHEGITWARARTIINKWLAQGKIELVGHRLSPHGKREQAYRFADNAPKPPVKEGHKKAMQK
jgi:hypothetical protein